MRIVNMGKLFAAFMLLAGAFIVGQSGQAFGADTKSAEFGDKFGKSLVVYYSFSGNTKLMAQLIAAYSGADIYEIQPQEAYPPIPEMYEYAKQQLEQGVLPQIKTDWPDFKDYDTIFVGGPVWWYTLALPLQSFLAKADFSGKTVIPFCSHGGNYGAFFKALRADAKNAKVASGFDFYRPTQTSREYLKSKIINWLSGLSAS